MSGWGDAVLAVVCLTGLVGGSELVIRHCVRLMKERGLSGGFLGLTVISIGTSLPELVTHVVASARVLGGARDAAVAGATALGTNVGSDIVQQNLLLAIVALAGGLEVRRAVVRRDFPVLVAAAVALWLAGLDGRLSRLEGGVLVAAYLGYLAVVFRSRRDDDALEEEMDAPDERRAPWAHGLWIAGGLAVVVGSGHLLLSTVSRFVGAFGLGGSLVGVAMIGVATALPEFSTALAGLRRKRTSLSVGTLVGSNITNPAFAAGVGALLSTYEVPDVLVSFDLPVKIGTGAVIWVFLWRHGGLRRVTAVLMIVSYAAYLAARVVWFPSDAFGAG